MTTAVPGSGAFRVGSERLHDAGAVGAERVRLGTRGLAQADPDVDAVERAGAHAHQRLAAPGYGHRKIAIHEHDLGAAFLMDPHGAHRTDRIRLLPMQDELSADGLLLGVARAEPYAETERLIARAARSRAVRRPALHAHQHAALLPPRAARARGAQRDRGGAAALAARRAAARRAGRPHAALRLERSLRAAARAPDGAGRATPGARCALRRLRRLQPPRRSRRRRARRARVLGAQHDGDRAGPGLVRRARRDRHRRRAGTGRRARAAGLRLVHALPRRLPDGRPDRARRARRDALHLHDDAGARADARRARGGARGSRLRLRHLPGRVPLERRPGSPRVPSCPRIRARGCRWPSGSSCPARSCWRGTRTSTCRSATRATCGATP